MSTISPMLPGDELRLYPGQIPRPSDLDAALKDGKEGCPHAVPIDEERRYAALELAVKLHCGDRSLSTAGAWTRAESVMDTTRLFEHYLKSGD